MATIYQGLLLVLQQKVNNVCDKKHNATMISLDPGNVDVATLNECLSPLFADL